MGEPFQLYQGSTLSHAGLYTTCDRAFATFTAQADGIHVWDLKNLHPAASYAVGEHVVFAAPAFSLYADEDGHKSVTSYVPVLRAPGVVKRNGCTIWIIRQNLSGPGAPASDKTAVVFNDPLARIYGTGLDTLPLLLVWENGGVAIANAHVEIKCKLDWPGQRKHAETFVFPRQSCTFVQDDTDSWDSVAVTCCRTVASLHVRVVLLGENIVSVGTCDIPIARLSVKNKILGMSCSPSGVFSFVDLGGTWESYQLLVLDSSLALTPLSEKLLLHRFASFNIGRNRVRHCFSIASLGTSIVLLAALVKRSRNIYFQVWNLTYGVLLAAQTMPLPPANSYPRLSLTIADQRRALLTMWGSRNRTTRPTVYVVPVDPRLNSSLATALGKKDLTTEWLTPEKHGFEGELSAITDSVRDILKNKEAQKAEQAFLKWVDSHSSKEAALGYVFIKKMLNFVLPPDPPTDYLYPARIIRCILENAVVSTIMVNGQLLTRLHQRGDWENIMLALTTVTDISEDELMAVAKFLVDKQRKIEDAMDVDVSEGYVPALWSYLFACVSYPFSAAPMCLAIRKHLPDAQDLVMILEILEGWIQGGDEHDMEELLRATATDATKPPRVIDSPPYDKTLGFLQALLDASFVALLQYAPCHDVLRRILDDVELEGAFIDNLEPLRGVLEPFAKTQTWKEKTGGAKEGPAEWRRRKKQLEQRAGLGVGSYRLEELVI